MAATLEKKEEFAISASADNWLKKFLRELDDLIVNVAAKSSTAQSGGLRLVNESSIKKTLAELCDVLEKGLGSGAAPPEAALELQPRLDRLKAICSSIQPGTRADAPAAHEPSSR